MLWLEKFRRRIKEAWQDLRVNYLYAKGGIKFRAPTPVEKGLAFGVRDLIGAGCDIDFDPNREVWLARVFPPGDLEIKYKYDSEDEGSLARFLMTPRIEIAKDPGGANEIYNDGIASMEAGAQAVDGRLVFKGNLQNWSENAYAALTLAQPNETVVGCVLSFQKGRLVYTIVLRGVFFEDGDLVEELVYPYLEAAFAWSQNHA